MGLSRRVIPAIGLGVYRSAPGSETFQAVTSAIKLGYRHIDTAQFYENELDVGRAINQCGIPREELFVTTKLDILNWGYDASIKTIRESLRKLNTPFIDLLLLHAPGDSATRAETWRALENLQTEGILKDIGVSNFGKIVC